MILRVFGELARTRHGDRVFQTFGSSLALNAWNSYFVRLGVTSVFNRWGSISIFLLTTSQRLFLNYLFEGLKGFPAGSL